MREIGLGGERREGVKGRGALGAQFMNGHWRPSFFGMRRLTFSVAQALRKGRPPVAGILRVSAP
jgi:hypothetical protein